MTKPCHIVDKCKLLRLYIQKKITAISATNTVKEQQKLFSYKYIKKHSQVKIDIHLTVEFLLENFEV